MGKTGFTQRPSHCLVVAPATACLENTILTIILGDSGSTVVKVLCYKSEGRWFDPNWCHWNFSLTYNPSDRTMALGSTQPLTEMSTRSISWG
jgi:hypothetical protein